MQLLLTVFVAIGIASSHQKIGAFGYDCETLNLIGACIDLPALENITECDIHSLKPTNAYHMKPMKLGVAVYGIDLKKPVSEETIIQIKYDLLKHRLLIFKNQGIVPAERQVSLMEQFGRVISLHPKHPDSPHHGVLRISNHFRHGYQKVGVSAWHTDGFFVERPYSYVAFHIISISMNGDTWFLPINELLTRVDKETLQRWDRLWYLSSILNVTNPILFAHPILKMPTLNIHLNMVKHFIWDMNTPQERHTEPNETQQIINDMSAVLYDEISALQYTHKWEKGDFIVFDNNAILHKASPGTQVMPHKDGIRIMHRTTVEGHCPLEKEYEHYRNSYN
ncbi:PREDICTED: alpha-ketoglutarate-dependent sulfate ester dioxygenase-like [Priapulus caudatus]|uniref:Alpha-ketoglutarate-dependent sulfate ester dioxygenase-like n=1 Tax=Priapulus caudatus TaxID=37621 RepID=A0ABM1EAI4_PRICU|nr:PREDICTED: alpha-ketoglutarate-dependent sulfate ester dioxygenase-like [Priapulus caudatus]